MTHAYIAIRKRAGETPEATIVNDRPHAIEREIGGNASYVDLPRPRARVFFCTHAQSPANLALDPNTVIHGDILVLGWDPRGDTHRSLTNAECSAIITWLRERAPWDVAV